MGDNPPTKSALRKPVHAAPISLSSVTLKFPDSHQEAEFQAATNKDAIDDKAGFYPYRMRLILYTLVLYVTMLLQLGGALVNYKRGEDSTILEGQLYILLALLCLTMCLFTIALFLANSWIRTLSQAVSFLLTCSAYLLMDNHFIGRISDSEKLEPVINGLVPVACLASLLPALLMYRWLVYACTCALGIGIAVGLRAGGLDWEIGLLETGMCVGWLIAFSILMYRQERWLRLSYFNYDLAEPEAEQTPKAKSVKFKENEEVIGTELDDILSKLDKVQMLVHETEVPGDQAQKKWAEDTLQDLMHKLATGTNIYQSSIQKMARANADQEDLKYLEQNYLDIKLDVSAVKQSSIYEVRTGSQLDFSFSYSVSELLPVLQKMGKNWNFDIFFVSQCTDNHALQTCGEYAMKKYKFQEMLDVSESPFRVFFETLASNYKPNPYHNSEHAADVLASLLFIYNQSRLMKAMKDLELFASVVAALGHDVGHPAVTNRFIINTRDPLAVLCNVHTDNDISVLEMMHCSMTFRTLISSDLLNTLPNESWELIRKVIIEMILATDMSKHFDLMGSFRAASRALMEFNSFEERLMMFKVAIKCADVGHAAKETQLHEKWTIKIVDEFFAQGDLEKDSNLAISVYCDRASTDVSKSQQGFITAIVQPLYEVANACLQSDAIRDECIKQLHQNIEYWKMKGKKRRNSLEEHSPEPATGNSEVEESRPLCVMSRSKTLLSK